MLSAILKSSIFHFYENSEGNWHLECVSYLRDYFCTKLPEDGTLVTKHIGVGT